jgi:hypothetical protein
MTFDTYANLQTEILAKLVRTADTDAIARCPSWITLAEDEMRMALSRLTVRQGELTNAAYSIAAEFNNLPTDFFRMRSNPLITSVSPDVSLNYVTPTQADLWDPNTNAGTPRFWTIQSNQLRVFPPPSTTFTASLRYFSLPSLSVSSTTNWLLTAHPKLYFKSALVEAYDYYDDAEAREMAQADRDRMLSAIYTSDGSDQQGTRMKIRVDNGTP